MESLASQLEAADAVDSLDLSCLHALTSMDDVRQTIETLLDAYNSHSGTAREAVQKQCVLRSLAELLELVQLREHTSSSSAQPCPVPYSALWRRHLAQNAHSAAQDAAVRVAEWRLTADDHLLLSMFLNETATTTDARAFTYWSRAATVVLPAATAFAYPAPSSAHTDSKTVVDDNVNDDEEAETTRASLESELHSLREIIAKRFTTSVEGVRRVTSYEEARRCLQSGVLALLGCLWNPRFTSRVAVELEAAMDGVLQPLHCALQEQLSATAGRADGSGGAARSAGKAATSPLLLTALLQDVEDVLWAMPHTLINATLASAAAATTKPKREDLATLERCCAQVAMSIAEALLKFAQQYIAHRQQRQMESMEEEEESGAGRHGGAAYGSRKLRRDVFRVYHVQRSVQRVLSVALQLRHTVSAAPSAKGLVEGVLVTDAAYSGLQAAASAFGGMVHVTDPFALHPPVSVVEDALDRPVAEGEDHTATDSHTSMLKAAASWSEGPCAGGMDAASSSSPALSTTTTSRLRACHTVLAPPHHLTSGALSGDGGAADGDLDFFNDEAATLLGRREAYLKTSLGPVTATQLVEMVMLTVSQMDFISEDAIQELHRRGLENMQLAAAYQAQREEVEKQRQMERQGVEAIAPGRLIEHVRDSAALQAHGQKILREVSARARLERAAFSSVLSSYAHVRGEAEARVRQTQALIARCLVQLPPSLADSAMDELFLHLRKELSKAQAQKDAAAQAAAAAAAAGGGGGSGAATTAVAAPANPNAGVALLFSECSYYQLTLQVLFMYYATQAPIEDRGGMLNSALMLGGANMMDAEGGDGGAEDSAYGGREVLHTEAGLSVEVDSPIAFLFDDDVHRASQDVGTKRSREEAEHPGAEDDGAAAGTVGAAAAALAGASGEREFVFLNDTVASPSTYSHVLCRVLELVRAARLNLILLDVLLQAPVLTRHVWYYLYKHLCLSADKTSCVIGMWLLRTLAERRPVYRTCAVNILLQLCLSTHDYARRFAIKEIGVLLSARTPQGAMLMDKTAEAQVVRYAKKQLFAIPAYQRSGGGAAANKLKRAHDGGAAGGGAADEAEGTALGSEEATAKDRVRMATVLNRHLGLFLMLCARQPRELFPALLEVFQQCVDRENIIMMQLLPENADVRRMTQHLLQTDAANFVSAVLPLLRKRCKEARPLVQAMLWGVREQLSVMAQDATAKAAEVATSAEGVNAASQASAAAQLEALRSMSAAVVGHAKVMYELSGIPLGDANKTVSLPDVRFVAPFLSFLSVKELKQTYLKSFLLFVQVQLQFQRHYHSTFHRLPAQERTYVLEATELRAFQIQVLREVFVKCPVPFQDGVQRGLTRVDFFVFVHRAPQESQSRAAAMLPNALHGDLSMHALGGGGAGHGNSSGGVLDALQDPSHGALQDTPREKAEELPPIGVGTTKEVVNLCFELTRSFDSTTADKLYGPTEIQKALQQLMHPPPVPSQLMATVLQAATLFMRSRNLDFIKFVVQTVLTPLERASVWDTDPQLWKGVILFTERYYRECSNFLVNLPDQVLTQALREHPQLCEFFKEEHGNNASFGHVLGSL